MAVHLAYSISRVTIILSITCSTDEGPQQLGYRLSKGDKQANVADVDLKLSFAVF
jgi:hypothetical protein